MTLYTVHLYREMKLFFPGIEAETHDAAAEFARQQPTDKAHRIEDCDGHDHAALVDVDVDGDEDHSLTRLIDFPTSDGPLYQAITNLISDTNDLIAAIEGTTDQFEPEVARLKEAVTRAEKVLKGGAQ
jgi:hypothetical protein